MSWQAMMCRHVLYNSVGLFVAFGILFGMVLHLWRWRRRCAPRRMRMKTGPPLPLVAPRSYIQCDPSAPYVPFCAAGTRIIYQDMPKSLGRPETDTIRIAGRKMKMPAPGDPVTTISPKAFYRLLIAPNWLTPDRYPPSVELAKGEIGCLLSHEGAVRVRVQGPQGKRSFNDRTLELVHEFTRHIGTMTGSRFKERYEELIEEWRCLGCPDYY